MTYNVFGVTLNLAQLNSDMARVLKGSHSILPAHPAYIR